MAYSAEVAAASPLHLVICFAIPWELILQSIEIPEEKRNFRVRASDTRHGAAYRYLGLTITLKKWISAPNTFPLPAVSKNMIRSIASPP